MSALAISKNLFGKINSSFASLPSDNILTRFSMRINSFLKRCSSVNLEAFLVRAIEHNEGVQPKTTK
jgi:hypothetical protein